MALFDFLSFLFSLIFLRNPQIQVNLEYLEGEAWFKQQYGRKLLNDYRFRKFIKKYNLKKVFQDDEQKEKFKRELGQWGAARNS
ncbi:hypothetical protein NIE88_01105 [Sporolactobacillus shoreicorticis]|uniref:Uncharacterized protein n=1 Tax=Sporolactobacillus shoreicorticis TaxID=1923877 RepID=A0ABW5S564_9BACL|nr:hypothetical protein [Sporolactobacillus shoreicorticis]MCO7124380.1 hypothetical protein [Sporolactobacillus shoreicorticis]